LSPNDDYKPEHDRARGFVQNFTRTQNSSLKFFAPQFNTNPHICFTRKVLSHFARWVTTAEIRAVRTMNTDEDIKIHFSSPAIMN